MARRIRNLVALATRFGWAQALTVIGLWTARQTIDYRRALIYCLDLERIPQLSGCDGIEWGYRSRGEISSALIPSTELGAVDDQRYFIGSLDGEQCYASVVSEHAFRVPYRVQVSLPSPTDAYVGDCFTLDAKRGRGIYPCGLAALGRSLRVEGKRRLYLFVERENLASIRSVLKTGFEPVAMCSVWRIGSFTRRGWRFLGSGDDRREPQLIVRPLLARERS